MLSRHEVQNNFFDRYLPQFETTMCCEAGRYVLPDGPGLGIAPKASLLAHAVDLAT
jgi:galactonate dehydratase